MQQVQIYPGAVTMKNCLTYILWHSESFFFVTLATNARSQSVSFFQHFSLLNFSLFYYLDTDIQLHSPRLTSRCPDILIIKMTGNDNSELPFHHLNNPSCHWNYWSTRLSNKWMQSKPCKTFDQWVENFGRRYVPFMFYGHL